MEETDFEIEWLDDVALFRLKRPNRLNAASRAIMHGLSDCFDAAEAGRARFVIVTAAGDRAFCAGTDLKESQSLDAGAVDAKTDFSRALMVRIARSPIISIAAINGLAFGGGLELAMACTFRIAAAHASFALPEIKLGLLPAYAGTQLLPALIGPSRALDIMVTGRTVDAAEALAIGLVNRVLTPGVPVVEEALAMAGRLAAFSADAIDALRRCIDAARPVLGDEGLAVEQREVQRLWHGPDAVEGVRAFLEKRSPLFNAGQKRCH